jgi:NADPH:quinone reductase-like Zn-dependent oxidoreductase
VAVGEGFLARFLSGRRVACSTLQPGNGTWAEYMLTSASLCVPLNKDVGLEEGAMLLVNPLTALAMFEMASAGKHRAIVSTAAAGALGGMIVRLGKRHNVPIINIVHKPEQVEAVKRRGAQYVLNSEEPGFTARLQELAQRLHATFLLDAVADGMTQKLADAAPYGSTILLYANLSQRDSAVRPHTLLVKHLQIKGWFLGNWMREKNLFQTLLLSRRAQALITDDLRSPVRDRLPLSAAQDGLEQYISGMSAGKMLFVTGSS